VVRVHPAVPMKSMVLRAPWVDRPNIFDYGKHPVSRYSDFNPSLRPIVYQAIRAKEAGIILKPHAAFTAGIGPAHAVS
jgi:hypothetical protein